MEQLTPKNAEELLEVLRKLRDGSRKVKVEWSHDHEGNASSGLWDISAVLLLFYTPVGEVGPIKVYRAPSSTLVFPVTTEGFVPRTKCECSVYYEVRGREVSFEFRGSELTHTRRFTFS